MGAIFILVGGFAMAIPEGAVAQWYWNQFVVPHFHTGRISLVTMIAFGILVAMLVPRQRTRLADLEDDDVLVETVINWVLVIVALALAMLIGLVLKGWL